MFGRGKKVKPAQVADKSVVDNGDVEPVEGISKGRFEKLWPVIACGSGLFSDGYINNVIGSVSTMLATVYGNPYTLSSGRKNISSITFAGTVIGMLFFGYTSDKWSRKHSLMVSTVILIVFAALGAGAYGYQGDVQGMFAALTAYRFLVGIGIGGEYPAGSVSCSEATGELNAGTRNRWFIMFTNVMIDFGFVMGALIPFILVVIFTQDHLRAAWRVALGVGVVPPILLLLLRFKLQEPEEFKRESMKHVKIPYRLVIKYYWKNLSVVSLQWFIYDFCSYSFSIYSSTILSNIYTNTSDNPAPLYKVFGWNTVINLFYIPGAILGAFVSDWIGPRLALATGAFGQAVVGFIMSGFYTKLARPENVGAFALVYGFFISLGELGPGDNIGLMASKTCATGVRGQYYAITASVGKIGAFVGTFVFPYISALGGDGDAQYQYPFYVSSGLGIVVGLLALCFLPNVGQDTMTTEDRKFREYLESHGWDTSQMGLAQGQSVENRAEASIGEVEKSKLELDSVLESGGG